MFNRFSEENAIEPIFIKRNRVLFEVTCMNRNPMMLELQRVFGVHIYANGGMPQSLDREAKMTLPTPQIQNTRSVRQAEGEERGDSVKIPIEAKLISRGV